MTILEKFTDLAGQPEPLAEFLTEVSDVLRISPEATDGRNPEFVLQRAFDDLQSGDESRAKAGAAEIARLCGWLDQAGATVQD